MKWKWKCQVVPRGTSPLCEFDIPFFFRGGEVIELKARVSVTTNVNLI